MNHDLFLNVFSCFSRLSVLRENFTTGKLKFLKFDIPLMALTATATKRVREDILKSLRMSKETNVVLTSFFRSNLRFTVSWLITIRIFISLATLTLRIRRGFIQVKHSRTSQASYEKDFHELIKVYCRKENIGGNKKAFISDDLDDASKISDTDSASSYDVESDEGDYDDRDINTITHSGNSDNFKKRKKLSVEFLENDVDVFQSADDLDGTDLSATLVCYK